MMMRKRTRRLLVMLAFTSAAAGGTSLCAAQSRPRGHGCGSSQWVPCLDSIGAGVAFRDTWRGQALSRWPVAATMFATVYGGRLIDETQAVLGIDGVIPLDRSRRDRTVDRALVSLELRHRLDQEDSRVWITVAGEALSGGDSILAGRGGTADVRAGVLWRAPPLLPENKPLVLAEVERDLRRFRATRLRAGIANDAALGPLAIIAWLSASCSDYPRWNGASRSFGFHDVALSVTASSDTIQLRAGRVRTELTVGVLHSPVSRDRTTATLSLRFLLIPTG